MKKFASILLVAAMALSLVACGGGDSSTPSTSTPAVAAMSTPSWVRQSPRVGSRARASME